MSQIIERAEAHYDTVVVPFGRIYHWHQAHVILECDCGEILTFSGTSAIITCWGCGADYGALVHGIHHQEEHLREEDVHPWHYDLKARKTNTYETRPLILRALRGATTTLQRAWGMIKRDGRRPEYSNSSPLHPLLRLQKGKPCTLNK